MAAGGPPTYRERDAITIKYSNCLHTVMLENSPGRQSSGWEIKPGVRQGSRLASASPHAELQFSEL